MISILTIDYIDSLDFNSNSVAQDDSKLLLIILAFSITIFFTIYRYEKKRLEKKRKIKQKKSTKKQTTYIVRTPRVKRNSLTDINDNKAKGLIYNELERETKAKNDENEKNKYKKNKSILNPTLTWFIEPETLEHTNIKYIGYEPNDFFGQEEPLNYPIVIMPRQMSVIKFPRKNKAGNKGYAEEYFFDYIHKYFSTLFNTYNDRILIISKNQNPFEPDITLIDENDETNLFIDIEIDEPYDGVTRLPMHYSGVDNERNKYFKNRGWLTIRFAEEQAWKYPEECCCFIFKVINSIDEKYCIPDFSEEYKLKIIPQWTFKQAQEMEAIKYREQYLGIDDFNKISNHVEYSRISDDNLENEIEDLVEENNKYYNTDSVLIKCSIIRQAINTGRFLSCKISDDHVLTVIEPISLNNNTLKCYCYLKNAERNLMVSNLSDLIIRNKPITVRLNGTLGVSKIKEVIKNAIEYNKIVRMKYTRSGWTDQRVDMETGEIILNITESEQSLRTICNIDYAINVLDEEHLVHYGMSDDNYITAFCNLRNEIRTFRVDRINEIEILNV